MEGRVRGPKDFGRIVLTSLLALMIGGMTLVFASAIFDLLDFRLKAGVIVGGIVWVFWGTAEWVLGKRSK